MLGLPLQHRRRPRYDTLLPSTGVVTMPQLRMTALGIIADGDFRSGAGKTIPNIGNGA